jgi:dipeptidyl aminopeptidase/acylaminoacyl peptidase
VGEILDEKGEGQIRIVYTHSSLTQPAELWSCDGEGGDRRQLTFLNSKRLGEIRFGPQHDLRFVGAKDEWVQAWLLKRHFNAILTPF